MSTGRRASRSIVIAAAVAAGMTVALVVYRLVRQPDEPDGFYDPPDPLPPGRPGTVIRSTTVAGPSGAHGAKILYRSTDPDGAPIAVSALVAIPDAPAPAAGRPVVAWAHPTSGVARRCAPSLLDDPWSQMPGIERFVAMGAIIVATDYPGLGTPSPHPYLVGASEARAVLDSVRALDGLAGAANNGHLAIWGHSQGGHAALWSAQVAPTYAPELDLVAVAAAAPATALGLLLSADLENLDGSMLGSMSMRSWHEFYGIDYQDLVTDRARTIIGTVSDECIEGLAMAIIPALESMWAKGDFFAKDPVTDPIWGPKLVENSVDPAGAQVPVLITQGEADTTVHPQITEDFVTEMRAAGVAVTLSTYPGVNHVDIADKSAAEVVIWLGDRLAAPR